MAGDPTPRAAGGSNVPGVPGISGGGLSAQINVTPMIDVMLVLLIIFMVVTPILMQYEATPPSAVTATPEPDDDVITLGIDHRGDFYLESQPVADSRLAAELQRAFAGSDRRPGGRLLYLRADRGIPYSRVLDAIEGARAAGVSTIGAITEPLETEAEAEGGS